MTSTAPPAMAPMAGAGEIARPPSSLGSATTAARRAQRRPAAGHHPQRRSRHGHAGLERQAVGRRYLKIGAYIHALRGTAMDNPLPGDAAHGEAVFWGKGQCGTCHRSRPRQRDGPDLSNIAAQAQDQRHHRCADQGEHRVYGDGGVHLPRLPPMDTIPVHVVTKKRPGVRRRDAQPGRLFGAVHGHGRQTSLA